MTGASPPRDGFAVVEMFTSQGCDSCPPAEEVLSEIDRDARERGERIYTLGFHVDYWDHLGWADPYGAAAHTLRQERYARALRSGGLYTPQMIVNGTVEFVGSDRRQATSAIDAALAAPPGTPVTLSVVAADAGHVVLDYGTGPLPEQARLNVAVVERGLENDVPRGENAGRRLRQDSVVRAFCSVELNGERGRLEIDVPASPDPRRASVVGYVQQGDRAVVGATAVDLGDGSR
ncbi:DUF1223 domain-containing protein [Micromonospora tulbaghiae]|uniref:DUF1223 domain-containing protein n=1 Tax=Micromonospora tulbaghiae TaxID=479978 RepID=UPI0036CEFBF9